MKEILMFCEFPYYILSDCDEKTAVNIINDSLKIKGFDAGSPRLFSNCKNKFKALK